MPRKTHDNQIEMKQRTQHEHFTVASHRQLSPDPKHDPDKMEENTKWNKIRAVARHSSTWSAQRQHRIDSPAPTPKTIRKKGNKIRSVARRSST
jgi:hypothetical protein